MQMTDQIDTSILIVEDEPMLRNFVSLALTSSGYQVAATANGREAMEQVAAYKPDLIISDVLMPEMDGFSLLTNLRMNPSTSAIPVIMMSGKTATDDVVTGIALGADDYLTKPFHVDELLARVRAKIERPPSPSNVGAKRQRSRRLTEAHLYRELEREIMRAANTGRSGCVALMYLSDPDLNDKGLRMSLTPQIVEQVTKLVMAGSKPLDVAGPDPKGRFTLMIPDIELEIIQTHLNELMRSIRNHNFGVGKEAKKLKLAIGFTMFSHTRPALQVCSQAAVALAYAIDAKDPSPTCYTPLLSNSATAV